MSGILTPIEEQFPEFKVRFSGSRYGLLNQGKENISDNTKVSRQLNIILLIQHQCQRSML